MPTAKEQAKKLRHNRIRSKIQGTAEKPRLVVYRSLLHIYAQLINDEKGVTLVESSDLKMKGKEKPVEKAKKVGEELAKKATEKKITRAVFDRNGYKYHGRVKALAEGARNGGLNF